MKHLSQILPDVYDTIVSSLNSMNRIDIVEQLRNMTLKEVSYQNAGDVAYIFLHPTPASIKYHNQGKGNETFRLNTKEWINIDIDVNGCVEGIEIVSPPAKWKSVLKNYSAT